MQHTVAKRFIYCKHNITIPHTQAISQKVITFFEECESWSHTSLFVWDWNCRARRIASDFTRFYRIAKCVTRRIWLDSHPKNSILANVLIQKKESSNRLLQGGESAGVRTRDPNIKSVVAPRPYKSLAYG